MEILYLLIPLSVVLVFLIGLVFWWSLRSGQYDDLEGPGYRVLMDDDRPDSSGPPNDGRRRKMEGSVPGIDDDLTHINSFRKPFIHTLPKVLGSATNPESCLSVGVGVRVAHPFFARIKIIFSCK